MRYPFLPPSQVRLALLVTTLLGSSLHPAQAQDAAPAALPSVTVSASGLEQASGDMATPVIVLEGGELVRRRAATLGDTLDSEPGIQATHFGAGASRPVIRGMDGPRVQILTDGSEVQDASSVSPDHAVVVEPLLARQIVVLRGPSALIHGGGAIGGVVNVLDNKIPTAIPENGIAGSAELRGTTAARETTGAFELTGGAGQLAVHVQGLARAAGDYRVGSGWGGGAAVPGSFNHTDNASLGLSWITDRGTLGLAYTRQTARYGLPGHNHTDEDCHTHGDHLHCGGHDGHGHGSDDAHAPGDIPVVNLRSKRWDLRGELRQPFAGIAAMRLRAGVTGYRHDEVEDGSIATTFRNQARNLRIELQQESIGGWRGVFGLQTSERRFSALGEEAYVQPTTTRRTSAFVLQQFEWQQWRVEGALRQEHQSVDALDAGLTRRHHGSSASLAAVWKFTPGYQLSTSLTHARRMPTAEELYANGLHLATSTFERGNPNLSPETAQSIDLALRKTAGDTTFSASVFHNRVKNYIYGRTLDELNGLQLLQYSQQDATFRGLEAQLRQRLTRHLGVTLFGDLVHARLSTGGQLPRIPAARAGLRLDAAWQRWDGQIEWVQVMRQNRIAEFETSTPGYGMLSLGATYNSQWADGTPWQFYVRASNLTNRLAYAHTSYIKTAAPLMGRNIAIGLRVSF
ncbi:MAG: TonB-dependent receptor [Comamonas sp. SCN 65-56]|uniref:TonB-dependent receptor domain-containing protein n=1 Tax=Comamonas sp. SCN 65-56 TaxID=1660095 RepID=UPI00086B6B85|nr:TonB-dependent receptor [Comamonas sp. SCN 65-56]ODS93982.1 MAG: TonB-dependent receptor [Comamonas sp. SCN 65-56]